MKRVFLIFLLSSCASAQTDYYIDYDDGIDSALGEKIGPFIMQAGSDTTTIVDANLNGLTITDNAASSGDYIWNDTRDINSFVDAWDDGTDTITTTDTVTGQTAGDTYYILASWKNVNTFTAAARTAGGGDKAFLRANVTWDQGTEAADITFTTDGGIDAYHELIGCDDTVSGVDPWVDNSDVKPIIDFEDGAFQCSVSADLYWRFERLHFKQSNDTSGMLLLNGADFAYVQDCDFTDTNGSSVEGIQFNTTEFATIDGCTFENCFGNSIAGTNSTGLIKNCTITAGVDVSTDTGIQADNGSLFWVEGTTFVGNFDLRDMRSAEHSVIQCRNVDWTSPGNYDVIENGVIVSEDDDATFESHLQLFVYGLITRETGTPRAGGASTVARLLSNANCGLNRPLVLGHPISGFRPVWVAAGSYTASVWVRTGSAWDAALTAAECYMVSSELDTAPARTLVQSTETITNDAAWTELTTTITPSEEGFVYFWVYLAEFEDASEYIEIDVLPVVE